MRGEVELKPCPFCQSQMVWVDDEQPGWEHPGRKSGVSTCWLTDAWITPGEGEGSAEDWNTRAEPVFGPVGDERREAILRILESLCCDRVHGCEGVLGSDGYCPLGPYADRILASLPVLRGEGMGRVANEWADMATSGLQWLRNIRDGISTPEEAIANMDECLAHCQSVRDDHSSFQATPSTPGSEVEASSDDGWRDIASAPRDGTPIWVAVPSCDLYRQQFIAWWHIDRDGEYWQDDADSEPEPTHWRPLPPPPSINKDTDA